MSVKSVNNGKGGGGSRSSLVGITALTTSMESAEAFDVGDTKVQHYGLLMKKPFGHKSGRWQKRLGNALYRPPAGPICGSNSSDEDQVHGVQLAQGWPTILAALWQQYMAQSYSVSV